MGPDGYDPPSLLEQGAPSLSTEVADVPSGFDFAMGDGITINYAAPVVTHDPAAAGKRIAAMCRGAALSDSNTSAPSERIDKDKTE